MSLYYFLVYLIKSVVIGGLSSLSIKYAYVYTSPNISLQAKEMLLIGLICGIISFLADFLFSPFVESFQSDFLASTNPERFHHRVNDVDHLISTQQRYGNTFAHENVLLSCPRSHKDIGNAYIQKYLPNLKHRQDLSESDKLNVLFNGMKDHIDSLNPPIADWNDHKEIGKRLGLC